MYWNNPLIECQWPGDVDPVNASLHQGNHCLFWNPHCKFDHIQTNQRLEDLCRWAQQWLVHDGLDKFVADPQNHYDIANLVKLNMWVSDIKLQGIVKPWLILDHGNDRYEAGTGDSRLRCLERIPAIQTVPAFVSTHQRRAHLYQNLEPVTNFDQFASICGAVAGQLFLFRLTAPQAPFGLYWYEYNSNRTRSVTPGQSQAVEMFYAYMRSHSDVIINELWFDHKVNWDDYRSNN